MLDLYNKNRLRSKCEHIADIKSEFGFNDKEAQQWFYFVFLAEVQNGC